MLLLQSSWPDLHLTQLCRAAGISVAREPVSVLVQSEPGTGVQQAEGCLHRLTAHCTYMTAAAPAPCQPCQLLQQVSGSGECCHWQCWLYASDQAAPAAPFAWEKLWHPLDNEMLKMRYNFVTMSSNHFDGILMGFLLTFCLQDSSRTFSSVLYPFMGKPDFHILAWVLKKLDVDFSEEVAVV